MAVLAHALAALVLVDLGLTSFLKRSHNDLCVVCFFSFGRFFRSRGSAVRHLSHAGGADMKLPFCQNVKPKELVEQNKMQIHVSSQSLSGTQRTIELSIDKTAFVIYITTHVG